MKVSLNWIRDYVKAGTPSEAVADRLTMAGLEVKKIENLPKTSDCLFEVEVTTNRSDWLSHIGVAREIAAVDNLKMKLPEIHAATSRKMPAGWSLKLKDAQGCPYYTGILLEGVGRAETPAFMRERLESCGLRSISLVVDITNYVLLETGQPLHAFDADLIRGQEVQIRKAVKGEKLIAIDGREYVLESEDLVIADRKGPIALAGIMGGRESEVTQATRSLFLESAFFDPARVRRTSRRLALASDSSYRFERRVDPEGVDFARQRVVYLLNKYAGIREIKSVLHAGEPPQSSRTRLHLTSAFIQNTLGVDIKPSQVTSILTRLGLQVATKAGGGWSVSIPSFRPDLTRPIDLVEEIARIYGYDKIPMTLPGSTPLDTREEPEIDLVRRTRCFLAGNGLNETVTFSLIPAGQLERDKELKKAVFVRNPQNRDFCWLRPTLAVSLLDVARKNFHNGAGRIALFEIANRYEDRGKGKQPQEDLVVGMLLAGLVRTKNWLDDERVVTFYDMKGLVHRYLEAFRLTDCRFERYESVFFQDGRCEAVYAGKERIGVLGQVSPGLLNNAGLEETAFYAEIESQKMASKQAEKKVFLEPFRFPAVERDIAVIVREEVKAGAVIGEIQKVNSPLIQNISVFDLFRGGRIPGGYKNLAVRIKYQSNERTLVSEEVSELHKAVADRVASTFQATFQS